MNIVVGRLMLVHSDERRVISEFNSPEGGFSVQEIRVQQLSPLGNHYHQKKQEIFTLLRGAAVLVTEHVDQNTGQRLPDTRETRHLEMGSSWLIPAWTAHTVVAEPGAVLHCVSSQPYCEKDKDMYPVILVKPEEASKLFSKMCGKMCWPPAPPANS